jgi:hypothetical protein
VQNYYLGKCWLTTSSGICNTVAGTGDLPMYRVVVAVTWNEQGCPATGCAYVVSALASYAADPVFS